MSDQSSSTAPPSKGPTVLASSRESISVQSVGTELQLALEPAALAELAPARAAGGGAGATIRMHLALEGVRGASDATVLRLFLRLAQPSGGDDAGETFLGSVGLYGLRRASVPETADGMLCYLDVTSHAALLTRAMSSQSGALVLAIRPHQPMPKDAAISIERIRLFAERFE